MTLLDLHAAKGPLIMGIVNVTPDSFSDGGRFIGFEHALSHARQLIAEGADVLDIGGESTRPGAHPVTLEEEISRVVPLIAALSGLSDTPISIDTLKPEVAEEAFKAGASIWNDVSALSYTPHSLEAAARSGREVILMHMQGEPRTMQASPYYEDVVAEVESYLLERAEVALRAGVARGHIWLDPGIGFGKTLDHNLALIRATNRLASHGFPLLMAASRKRFIAALEERECAEPAEPELRVGGTLAVHLHSIAKGAKMVRVHDVLAMKQALRLWTALEPS
ncbi:dihydropteroate synthase [Asticcacaulis benevestitus]|uniref:Dihydropteroate synthase n=1 Tax=Asticcacaulis benevestitus DSM 16100 = ATCC BAA-896 TaxID=1121022 RepID=V4PYD7_9CAUL|nr:dihydropteroate synthase [Asticcacaulis benevestitus]ESQ92449.1 dihydropteroate synthase [Asticcacaulis benevestitus DSM 16100 = ATCC BAA-896]